jgi:hypothetical protein
MTTTRAVNDAVIDGAQTPNRVSTRRCHSQSRMVSSRVTPLFSNPNSHACVQRGETRTDDLPPTTAAALASFAPKPRTKKEDLSTTHITMKSIAAPMLVFLVATAAVIGLSNAYGKRRRRRRRRRLLRNFGRWISLIKNFVFHYFFLSTSYDPQTHQPPPLFPRAPPPLSPPKPNPCRSSLPRPIIMANKGPMTLK